MNEAALLQIFAKSEEAEARETSRASVTFKRVSDDEQIVFGEVYAPDEIDTHGEMMLAEDVRLIGHRFLAGELQKSIDIMHDNRVIKAVAVESFIARAGDTWFTEGAWVVATFIEDPEAWAAVKSGKLSGYSLEAMVYRVPAVAEIQVVKHQFGVTEQNDGHDHAFYLKVDDEGRVTGGYTSSDEGHSHSITAGTATEETESHSHRLFLM